MDISLKAGLAEAVVAAAQEAVAMNAGEDEEGVGTSGAVDRSMLPGHSTTSLAAKLEATRRAFKAATSLDSLSSPKARRPASGTTRSLGGAVRGSDPGPQPARAPGERPRAYNCYLCGCQYGSASLMIHIRACQQKWLAAESVKPARERRPLPAPPPEIAAGELPSGQAADDFNQSMADYWDANSLVACPICARTFRPEAFAKHQKVCTPDRPGGPLGPGRKTPAAGAVGTSGTSGGGAAGAAPGALRSSAPAAAGAGPRATSARPRTPSGMASKPRAYSCYLCGQQYGSQSLFIHIPQCQKKFLMVESTKPPRERRALPPPPPMLTELEELPTDPEGIDEFNAAMTNHWNTVSLVGCKICGRTFRPEAFEKHQKVCTADNPGGPLGMPKGRVPGPPTGAPGGSPRPGTASRSGGGAGGSAGGGRYDTRPRAYTCYLCGQQYGSQSLHIHIPQCYEKWLKVEHNKDPKDRREPPPPPAELDDPLPTSPEAVDAFNQRMSDIYNGQSLMPCRHCGRTMRPEALAKHQKLCTADNPMKGGAGPSGGGAAASTPTHGSGSHHAQPPQAQGGAADSEAMETCQHCGRTMRGSALVKHHKVCTADKPMRGVRPTASPAVSAGGAPPSPPLSPTPPSPAPPQGSPGPDSPARRIRGASARPMASTPPPAGPKGISGAMRESVEAPTEPVPKGQYQLPDTAAMQSDSYQDEEGREECPTCGRRFAPDALAKHSRVCQKVFAQKRKPFNMAKQRLQGTEAAGYQRPSRTQTASSHASPAVSYGGAAPQRSAGGALPKWKAQSQELRAAMANMRAVAAAQAQGISLKDIPVQYSGPDPSYRQCPHCGRHFNQKAAERHIPSCANTSAKPKFLKAGTGGSGKGAPQSKPLPRW